MGRPTIYTEDLADEICERLADGESMRSIGRDPDMPSKATMFSWLRTKPEFLAQYEIAKQESAESHADDMIDIADNATNDWMEMNASDAEKQAYRVNGEAIQRSKLRVDTRKWAASKLNPKKYGEKTAIVGEDGGAVKVEMTDSELAKRLAFLLAKGANDATE
ncbi:MAG TPA: terminase small subunit protein [Porticoccaceae bacterium]|nr:terminase small subunit protein [Porticoccaceae bacterium]